MHIDHIREFLTLSETLSFCETSRRLYITQSALSRHIASMEEELGARLFARDSHGVALTQQGSIFVNAAHQVIEAYDASRSRITESLKAPSRTLKVGYLYDAMRELLPAVNQAVGTCPNLKVSFQALEFGTLMLMLRREFIDVAFTIDLGLLDERLWETVPVAEDRYYLAVPHGHRLDQEEPVSLASLAGEHIIAPDPDLMGDELREFFMRCLTDEGRVDNVPTASYNDIPSLAYQLEQEQGCSLMFGHHRQRYGHSLAFVPLAEDLPSVNLSAVWPRYLDGEPWKKALRKLSLR